MQKQDYLIKAIINTRDIRDQMEIQMGDSIIGYKNANYPE